MHTIDFKRKPTKSGDMGGGLKVLIAASGGSITPYLCGISGGTVGMMFSLDTPIYKTYDFMPYAIDNGKYQAVIKHLCLLKIF